MTWPRIEALDAGRVRLQPLTVDHALPMVDVLADSALYGFIGGRPPTLAELQRRYAAQVVGHSPNQAQWWLNWIVLLRDPARAIGYVQATVEQSPVSLEGDIAWVVAPDFQGRGAATAAAGAMIDWLTAHGVGQFVAHIHPRHGASQGVARKLGLCPTAMVEDGEVRWQSTARRTMLNRASPGGADARLGRGAVPTWAEPDPAGNGAGPPA